MDQAKVKVIQDWPEPRRVKDVQSFLGFANFYRRFINDYAKIVIPLTRLTRKSIPFQFSEKAREAFVNLKNAFTTGIRNLHRSGGVSILKRGHAFLVYASSRVDRVFFRRLTIHIMP